MLNKISAIKNKYDLLGKYTKSVIKISLIFIVTCLIASFVCFMLKDFTSNYIFFYRASEELFLAAKGCFGVGSIFSIIGIKTELQ